MHPEAVIEIKKILPRINAKKIKDIRLIYIKHRYCHSGGVLTGEVVHGCTVYGAKDAIQWFKSKSLWIPAKSMRE